MINSKFKVAAVLASIAIIFIIYYLYISELIYDDEGRAAFIEEHKDAYKNHSDKKHKITKKLLKNLSDEQRIELKSEFKSLKAEFQALKTQLETDGELSKDEKRDLRMQFVEKARAIQLSWITPQN